MPDAQDVPTNTAANASRQASGGPARRIVFVAVAALVVAVLAVAVAIWAVVRSSDEAGPSAQASEDAKAQTCAAFETVQRAVMVQTNADLGPDPIAMAAVAANARLATTGGGQYLLNHLDPATPSELADAVDGFANNLLDLGMGQLAGTSTNDPAQADRMTEIQTLSTQIANLCR